MPILQVPKHEVACELLERAIELYLRGDSFYSALHLGGAAEELLSVYAREVQVTPTSRLIPAFDQMKAAIVAFSGASTPCEIKEVEKWACDRLNDAKNSVKHKRGAKDNAVTFSSREEASDVIDRAITTYFQLHAALRLPHIALIQEFDKRRHTHCPE